MSQPIDWKLLDRYLAGEASPPESAVVEGWLRANPANEALLRSVRTRIVEPPDVHWNVDAAWTKMAGRMAGGGGGARDVIPLAPRKQNSINSTNYTWRIAAGLLLVVGSAATWRLMRNGPAASSPGPAAVAMKEVATPNGKRATIDLADGSRVTLNAGSHLRYPADMNASRDVTLTGEAYFEVKHDAARPFRVHARGGVVQDIGTHFTVRAYPELSQLEVVVTEGLVSMRRERGSGQAATSDSAIVAPGQRGRLAMDGPIVVEPVPVEHYTGWTKGALVLDNVTLAKAVPDLERWFDVDVTFGDPALAGRTVNGTFRGDNGDEAFAGIALALGIRYEKIGRTVTFLAPPK
jgi:ferric-dicitrate binding protein FerR (iron transport regulator)